MATWWQRRWLQTELNRLVEAGLLPPEIAERLRRHYGVPEARRAAVPLLAILGVALVGLGVILLLAVNWETLSRATRAGLCFALLLAAQGLAGWALLARRPSVAWSEGAALALVLASGAAIALVGQTYHVAGDLRSFLTSWLLLAAPVPYLFDARAAAALYLLGAWQWLAASLAAGEPASLAALFLLAALPFLVLRARHEASARDAFLGWVAVPVLAFGALAIYRIVRLDALVLLAATVLAGTYALGATARARAAGAPFYAAPAERLGGLAIAAATFALGYVDVWRFVGEMLPARGRPPGALDAAGALTVGLAFAVLAGRGLWQELARGAWPRALLAAFPLVVGAGILAVHAFETRYPGAALANAYGLALGIGLVLLGLREGRLRLANQGLLLLGALVLARFADLALSYRVRGLVFIALGVVFLLLNLRLARRKRP